MLRLTAAALALGPAAALAACGEVKEAVRTLPRPEQHRYRRAKNEDEPLLESARSDQRDLLALCVATRREHPRLDAALTRVVEHHRRQVEALGASSTTPSEHASIARNTGRALDRLVRAERRAADARAEDALNASSGDFARVLAAISVSCSQHAVELGQARATLGTGDHR